MTAKLSASADGTKVTIGTAAEDALQIDTATKLVKTVAPYDLSTDEIKNTAGVSAMTIDALGKVAFPQNAQSLTQNGYAKLPGGLIIQWGISVPDPNGARPVTFPVPFPTECLNVIATPILYNSTALVGAQVSALTTSNFQIVGSGTTGGAVVPAGESIYWQAIGY